MKEILNFRQATVSDIESDGLLEEATLLHVLGFKMHGKKILTIEGSNTDRLRAFFQHHIDNKIPIVGHNFITYDTPLAEKLLGLDLSGLIVIDTLLLSWYINPTRQRHGLDTFGKKVQISDWSNQSAQDYADRVIQDVKLNTEVWVDILSQLDELYEVSTDAINTGDVYVSKREKGEVTALEGLIGETPDEAIGRLLQFLMYKGDTMAIKQSNKVKADVELLNKTLVEIEDRMGPAKETLESVMPKVPQYAKKGYPKRPFNKAGLSATGKAWNDALDGIGKRDKWGNALTYMVNHDGDLVLDPESDDIDDSVVKILKDYKAPNIGSPAQIKALLYSHGWKPRTFKFVKDKEATETWVKSGYRKDLKPKPRMVPQISKGQGKDKQLCDSVTDLAEKVPEIMAYAQYTTIKHRRDMLKGFLRDMDSRGYLTAGVGGFTNTLRVQHRELVNLPGTDKIYGEQIRGILTCEDDEILMGSDLSGLEDRVKLHFAYPFDPVFVEKLIALGDEYDPHIDIAHLGGFIDDHQLEQFKLGKVTEAISKARKSAKAANYGCVYGAAAETIAREAGIPIADAKKLHKAYWQMHHYVKKIAEEQYVFEDSRGLKWLVNPVNGFCYNIRAQKDIFSTLIQGTGSYFFDIWVSLIMEKVVERYGVANLIADFHDEFIARLQDTAEDREFMENTTTWAIKEVNTRFKLRVPLDCGDKNNKVDFDKRYSGIH